MQLSGRLLVATTILFGAGVTTVMPVVAGDGGPRVAAAETGRADAFPVRGKLNDAELKAVSGLGADAAGDAEPMGPSEVSVILFDELGRPKRDGLSPGSGANSTVVRGVNVQVGR
jgi:hypothetical protein